MLITLAGRQAFLLADNRNDPESKVWEQDHIKASTVSKLISFPNRDHESFLPWQLTLFKGE
jgi:hypothetical protein